MIADLILYNGKIHTQLDDPAIVSACAIRAGKIVAIGTDDDIKSLASDPSEMVNLTGKTVIPGLVDAHVHFSWYAHFLHSLKLTETASEEMAVQRVAEYVKDYPEETWIQGRGWDQDNWPGKRFPSKGSLDKVAPHHPVFLTAHSEHAAWVNSNALNLAGITANTTDPPGGYIGRDDSGNPDGMLFETAMELVRHIIPNPSLDLLTQQIKGAVEQAHKHGLTGIHDFDGIMAFRAYQTLHANEELNFRIVKNIPVNHLDHIVELGVHWGFGDEMLRIGGIKTFADGALGPRTAHMIEPYENEPDNLGICVTDPEEMMDNVRKASEAGLPSTIHAIGDRAVHDVLNVYEQIRKEEAGRVVAPDKIRHRIEHVQVIHPDDVSRLGNLNIIASMQPNHMLSDMEKADAYWGKRAELAYNWRAQLDSGTRLALGSDAPIEPIQPLPNLASAVTRRRANGFPSPEGWRSGKEGRGRLTIDEAVRGFTVGPAYAGGMEKKLGKLGPGFLADLVVLDQDIYTCDPMNIKDTVVLGTMINGDWVYRGFD